MTIIISYSGGLGSACSVLLAHKHGLEYEAVFADTLIEHPTLYALNDALEQRVGKRIHRLTDGRTPWDVFIDKRYIGNTRTAHCSDILKTQMVRQWLDTNYPGAWGVRLALGMTIGELDRIERAQAKWAPIPVMSLLRQYGISSRQQMLGLLKEYWLPLPSLYAQGYPHNNCGGFCVRSGQKQFVTLLLNDRERYLHHESEMERAMTAIGATARPFLRVTIGGVLTYVTLKQFRVMYEAGELTIDPYDWGGCACFVD